MNRHMNYHILLHRNFKWTQIVASHSGWGKQHLPKLGNFSECFPLWAVVIPSLPFEIREMVYQTSLLSKNHALVTDLPPMFDEEDPFTSFLIKREHHINFQCQLKTFLAKEMFYLLFSPGKNGRLWKSTEDSKRDCAISWLKITSPHFHCVRGRLFHNQTGVWVLQSACK